MSRKKEVKKVEEVKDWEVGVVGREWMEKRKSEK